MSLAYQILPIYIYIYLNTLQLIFCRLVGTYKPENSPYLLRAFLLTELLNASRSLLDRELFSWGNNFSISKVH